MSERKTIRKIFLAWDFEKEERWLNEMAEAGWALDGVGFCTYHFVSCDPGAYTVRLEMHEVDPDYLAFMEETGAEYVGRVMQWVYFRRAAALGSFDLFSDLDSRIAHLGRIGSCLGILGAANLAIGMANTVGSPHLSWINLLCATLLMYGLGRIHGKLEALREKRRFVE